MMYSQLTQPLHGLCAISLLPSLLENSVPMFPRIAVHVPVFLVSAVHVPVFLVSAVHVPGFPC